MLFSPDRILSLCLIAWTIISAILTIVPVIRFSSFSLRKHEQETPVYVHPPVSAICAGVGAILAMFVAFLSIAGYTRNSRKERPGRWYQFNNELELPSEKSEKPQLVFINEPLPEKPGMEPEEKEPIN